MREFALVLAIVGIFLLLGILVFSPAREIDSLNDAVLKEKVILRGAVDEERIVGSLNIMKVNGIEVVCECVGSFKGKNVTIEGVVEEYNGKRQGVLRIKEKLFCIII